MKNKLTSTVCVLICVFFALSAAAGCARQNVSSEAAVSSRTATAVFGQYAVTADSEEIIELYHQYFDLTDEMKAEFAEHGYTEAQIADMDRADYEQISLYWTNAAAAQTSLMPDSQRLQWLEEQGIDTGDEYFLDIYFYMMQKQSYTSFEDLGIAAEETDLSTLWESYRTAFYAGENFSKYKSFIRDFYFTLEDK